MKNSAIKSADKLLEELKKAKGIIEEARKSTRTEFLSGNLKLEEINKNEKFLSNNYILDEFKVAPVKKYTNK